MRRWTDIALAIFRAAPELHVAERIEQAGMNVTMSLVTSSLGK